jgi:hypothetical protein
MKLNRAASRSKQDATDRSVREKDERSFLTLKSISQVSVPSLSRKLSIASVLALLTVLSLSGASLAQAQAQNAWTSTGWVSSATMYDLTGNSNLAQNSALEAGHSYNLTLQISVPNTSVNTFQVSLNPLLLAATGQPAYWAVHNPSYQGYDRAIFIPGSKSVTFNYTQGTLSLSAYFQVPANFTNPSATFVTPSGNVTESLHLPQDGVILVSVVPGKSTGTGSFSASVSDQTIQTYVNDYNQTAALIPSGKISSTYSTLVNSLLADAQALNKLGFPDQGTALLNAIVPSAFPTPPSGSSMTYLTIGLIVVVLVVILLAVMTVRSRGRSGYSVAIVNDVQKDLAVLEVTAAKYDKAMADKIKSLRDKLSETN